MQVEPDELHNTRRHQASVYDAVAGRVGYDGFLTEEATSKYRDTFTNSRAAIPPDEVLFRRKAAPPRFEEDDVYFQDRHLDAHQRLPESDLLKAVHAYASDFYSTNTAYHGKHDFRSFDETALIAMGILLEETAAESLGKTGDLALVEDAAIDDDASYTQQSLCADSAMRRSVIDHRAENGSQQISEKSKERCERSLEDSKEPLKPTVTDPDVRAYYWRTVSKLDSCSA